MPTTAGAAHSLPTGVPIGVRAVVQMPCGAVRLGGVRMGAVPDAAQGASLPETASDDDVTPKGREDDHVHASAPRRASWNGSSKLSDTQPVLKIFKASATSG